MSGTPSCALTAPSQNCTALWTMDCGWTSTSICSGFTPKSQRASMTSKPLFIIVAESIVILAPMSQFGWRKACSGVTSRSCSFVNVRNGPPEAVRSILSILLFPSPARHWKMAECSLSTGRMGARKVWASCVTSSPATTSVSLLARAMSLRARMACMVGNRPAKPTSAVSTTSTSWLSTT